MNASWALQQAVFTALTADTGVHALVADRIFDAVPRGAAFPYVVLGEGEESADGTATDQASAHTLSLRIWSRGGGHREIKAITGAVRSALETATLTLSGHVVTDFRFASADFSRQPDGETFRAELRFKAATEPQP